MYTHLETVHISWIHKFWPIRQPTRIQPAGVCPTDQICPPAPAADGEPTHHLTEARSVIVGHERPAKHRLDQRRDAIVASCKSADYQHVFSKVGFPSSLPSQRLPEGPQRPATAVFTPRSPVIKINKSVFFSLTQLETFNSKKLESNSIS